MNTLIYQCPNHPFDQNHGKLYVYSKKPHDISRFILLPSEWLLTTLTSNNVQRDYKNSYYLPYVIHTSFKDSTMLKKQIISTSRHVSIYLFPFYILKTLNVKKARLFFILVDPHIN